MSALSIRRAGIASAPEPQRAQPSAGTDSLTGPGYVETPTSTKIIGALEIARATPTISIVVGAAGCGKTTTAKSYAASSARGAGEGTAYYVFANAYNRSPTAILHKIAEAVGAYYVGGYRNHTIAQNILGRLREGDLIIIDEAQHLEARALDGVRSFLDEGNVGIAYLGNEEIYTRISRKGRRAAFAQLHSRVGMHLDVQCPTAGDVDCLLSAWGIRGRQERAYALQIANQPGALRVLEHVLSQARIAASEMKRPLDRSLMVAIAGMRGLVD